MFASKLSHAIFPTAAAPLALGVHAAAQRVALPSLRKYSAAAPVEESKVSIDEQEWKLRVDLAACYRIAHMLGWSDTIYNHISVRLPRPGMALFLLNPYGLGYEEVTASGLVVVDGQGNIVEKGSATGVVNKAGFIVHGAVHEARPDAHAVMHTHDPPAMAVSAMKCGLLPMTQDSLIFGPVSYHDYGGLAMTPEEFTSLQRDLGPTNSVLVLRNHGMLTLGHTIQEALIKMYYVSKCCQAQVYAMGAGGVDALHPIPKEVQALTHRQAASFNKQGVGQLEFAYLRRKLDKIDQSYMS